MPLKTCKRQNHEYFYILIPFTCVYACVSYELLFSLKKLNHVEYQRQLTCSSYHSVNHTTSLKMAMFAVKSFQPQHPASVVVNSRNSFFLLQFYVFPVTVWEHRNFSNYSPSSGLHYNKNIKHWLMVNLKSKTASDKWT